MSASEIIATALAVSRAQTMDGAPAIDDQGRPHVEFWDDATDALGALADAGYSVVKLEQVDVGHANNPAHPAHGATLFRVLPTPETKEQP